MADTVYNRFHYNVGAKLIDLNNDTVKAALLTNSYTPDKDHNVWTDVSTYEVSGTGYTAGGQSLVNQAYTEDDTNDLAKFDADNPLWTSATITAAYMVLYDDTMATDDLMMCFDFGGDKSSSGGDYEVQVDANGLFKSEQGT